MKKSLLVIFLALPLLLVGCGSGKRVVIPTNTQIVVMPPAYLFSTCPDIPELPSGEGYTQRDVALYITELYNAGKLCKDNLEKVESYLLKAKKTLEKK